MPLRAARAGVSCEPRNSQRTRGGVPGKPDFLNGATVTGELLDALDGHVRLRDVDDDDGARLRKSGATLGREPLLAHDAVVLVLGVDKVDDPDYCFVVVVEEKGSLGSWPDPGPAAGHAECELNRATYG